MANEEHLSILKSGVSTWNKWRFEHREISPDLVAADLTGASLYVVDFSGAHLSGVVLSRATLRGADLSKADLTRADLRGTDLTGARLIGVDLRSANLNMANLRAAQLSGADLSGALLIEADMAEADLSGTDLSVADLNFANLTGANLSETDLRNSIMWSTVLADVDLSGAKGLETVSHIGPSHISIDTIYRSKGKIPKAFLEGAGVPEKFILYMDSLVWEGVEFYSCFISYASREEDFARRLYEDLKRRKIRCWLFPEDAKWGEPVWGEIDSATKLYDKLAVLCSEQSLQSGPVLREIERALQREDAEKKNILFPIRLDNYLFEKWKHPRKADVVSKVVGDFRGYEDQKVYDKVFERLVHSLNEPQDKDGA